jgi:hypothetical protein
MHTAEGCFEVVGIMAIWTGKEQALFVGNPAIRVGEDVWLTRGESWTVATGLTPLFDAEGAGYVPFSTPGLSNVFAREGDVAWLAGAVYAHHYEKYLNAGGADTFSFKLWHRFPDGCAMFLGPSDEFYRTSARFARSTMCLINYWTIIERLLNDLWNQMQRDFQAHRGADFIDRKRRDRLEDRRTFNASVMSEMLSFLDYIPKDLYDDMSTVRKVRNDWMHKIKSVDAETARLANSVCERLLKQVKDLTLIGATSLKIHG